MFRAQTITGDRRKACVKQLMPTVRQLDCVRVYLFGASGVGKSQLIESLQVTMMQNLWRRGSALLSVVAGGGKQSVSGGGKEVPDPNKCTGNGFIGVPGIRLVEESILTGVVGL